jgi:hypothetical protein
MIRKETSWTSRGHAGYFTDNGVYSPIIIIVSGVGLSPLYCGHFWPIVPAPDDGWGWLWSNWWNEDWQGKPKYSEKICPSATLSTTNATWPDPGSNPGRLGWNPATNRLSYGAACTVFNIYVSKWQSPPISRYRYTVRYPKLYHKCFPSIPNE